MWLTFMWVWMGSLPAEVCDGNREEWSSLLDSVDMELGFWCGKSATHDPYSRRPCGGSVYWRLVEERRRAEAGRDYWYYRWWFSWEHGTVRQRGMYFLKLVFP